MTSNAERRALWRQRLAEQQASGLSMAAWCAQQEVKLKRFYIWRRRFRTDPLSPATPQWVPVTLAPADAPASPPLTPGASGVTLQVGAVTIAVAPGFHRQVLREVLATLEAVC